jgi:hypothetical protein
MFAGVLAYKVFDIKYLNLSVAGLNTNVSVDSLLAIILRVLVAGGKDPDPTGPVNALYLDTNGFSSEDKNVVRTDCNGEVNTPLVYLYSVCIVCSASKLFVTTTWTIVKLSDIVHPASTERDMFPVYSIVIVALSTDMLSLGNESVPLVVSGPVVNVLPSYTTVSSNEAPALIVCTV